MNKIRNNVHVRLRSTTASIIVETLLLSEPQQKQFQVVNRGRIGNVTVTSAFLQVSVVSRETTGEC